MSPIPSSGLPGHASRRVRIKEALDLCQESAAVDFKQSMPWTDIRESVARTLMAMGNLRDGGLVIIGVAERGAEWVLEGISEEHIRTYDADDILSYVNSLSSPAMELDIVTYKGSESRIFLAIFAREFREAPFVCKKNSGKLKRGGFYVRPAGLAQTIHVANENLMHDLLELAAEKIARRILETSRRVGFAPVEGDRQKFDAELGGL